VVLYLRMVRRGGQKGSARSGGGGTTVLADIGGQLLGVCKG